MKRIELGGKYGSKTDSVNGKYALVDDDIHILVSNRNWYVKKCKNNFYASTNIPSSSKNRQENIVLHKFIFRIKKNKYPNGI